ncbi:MAG: DoxX family protein [Balneolaceae bacterium]|jgi:putative oxidoreductase
MLKRLNSSTLSEFVDPKIAVMILRIAAAVFIIYGHGFGKVMNVLSGHFPAGFDPIGIGPEISMILSAFAEGICAFLVLIGYWTRLASLFLIVNMSVAAFVQHASDPFGIKEKALLFLLIWITIFLLGPGKWSLDERQF